MKNIVQSAEKQKLAFALYRMAGRLPSLRRALKSLIGIHYFISPAAHAKGHKHYLILPQEDGPEIKYPVVKKKPENRQMAVITGATSGIGREFARSFARLGYDLLITGRRRDVIAGVAAEIRKEYRVKVRVVIADLSVKEDVASLLQVIGMQQNITALVNNAGYGMKLSFSEDEIDHQLDMVSVHVDAPLMLIHKVLPRMIENRSGIIINVSSMASYFPTSGGAMYTGTKSFLRSFSESLHLDVGRYGIRVQCLCPGFTVSDFHRNSNLMTDKIRNGLLPWIEPSAVVQYSLKSLERGMVVCVPGFRNRFLVWLASVMPRNLYYHLSLRLENKFRQRKESHAMAVLQQG